MSKNKKSQQRTIRIYNVEVTDPFKDTVTLFLVLAQNKKMAELQINAPRGCKFEFIPITSSRPSQEEGWTWLTQNKLRILFKDSILPYDQIAR